MSSSPYEGVPVEKWKHITKKLLIVHPLKPLESDTLVKVTLKAWQLICKDSVIGGKLRIGIDLFPKPQVLGDFLHELIPYLLEKAEPLLWRRDATANEKDIVHIPENNYSIEIKTSSHASGIYGNRSFSQKGESKPSKKSKSGYYLTINFTPMHITEKVGPIKLIRFGWLVPQIPIELPPRDINYPD